MRSYRPQLLVIVLLVACFGLAAQLEVWFQSLSRTRGSSVIAVLIGDSRRLFANHFFAKADAYFHAGYYPSMFDAPMTEGKSHMEEAASGSHGDHDDEPEHDEDLPNFLGLPRDWIDKFGRNFFPSEHVHMRNKSDEREILPWLQLTAELDPQKIEAYAVAAFALRSRLGKVDEAEQFLRQGLRANPGSPELLLEMGKIRFENRKDPAGARNLWELGLRNWLRQDQMGLKPEQFVHAQLLGQLAHLEEMQGNPERAIFYFSQLKQISTMKSAVEQRIQELRAKGGSTR